MKEGTRYWAGRVRFFLSHTPPGANVEPDSEVLIAHVKWYNHLSNERDALSATLDCPVFKASFKNDDTCDMWPIEKLAPCQLSVVRHRSHKGRVVVLNRFSDFLDTVPT